MTPSPKTDDRLTREQIEEIAEAQRNRIGDSALIAADATSEEVLHLCDLALRGLEIPVMTGPAGMQKAYDKGFADAQDELDPGDRMEAFRND